MEPVSTLEEHAAEAHPQSPAAGHPRPFEALLARAYLVNWELVAYSVIFVLAILTRFVDLGARTMSHDESLHTKFSFDLYQNGIFQHTPLMHGPLLFHMTALAYALFGDSDFSARIYTAVIGVLVVMMPILFRRWLGKFGAVLASVMFLLSPMLMYYSRYIRHDMPAIFFALLMVWAIFQYIDGPERVRRKPYWLYLLAAAMVLLLASKEVSFIYIAIFGTFLALYWFVQLGQRYLKLRNGKQLFSLLMTGVVVGAVISLGVIVTLTIIPPTDYDLDGVSNGVDNCVNIANTGQLDSDGDGLGDACQVTAGPSLVGRIVVWTLGVIAVVGVVVIGSALWAMRGSTRRDFPWAEIVLIIGVAVVVCAFFIVFEEASRYEVVSDAPADPDAADVATTGAVSNTPIILAWVLGAVITAIAIIARPLGFWDQLREMPVVDVMVVIATLVLPWATAAVIYATGAQPTDYTPAGIARAAISLVPFAAVAVAVGLAWNWRVWLPTAGIFMALYAFFFTTMFTNGQGLASGMIGSLGYWLEQQGVRRGNQPQYYYVLLMVPFYEFLPLLGSIGAGVIGLVAMWRHRLAGLARLDEAAATVDDVTAPAHETVDDDQTDDERTLAGERTAIMAQPVAGSEVAEKPRRDLGQLTNLPMMQLVGYWTVLNLIAYTLAGEKMPWLTTHLTVPMILATGWFGERVIRGIAPRLFKRHSWRLLIFIPLFLLAGWMVLRPWALGQYPFQGLTQIELERTYGWLAALAVAAGTVYAIARVAARIGVKQLGRVAVVSVGIMLMVVTGRSAVTASFINADYPNEFLVYAHGADHQWLMDMLEEISLRVYGDMTLRVAYDHKMSWPGSWYFREFPNAVYFGTSPSVQVLDDAVAVVVGEESRARVEPLLGDRYYAIEAMRLWWPMQDYFNLTAVRVDEFFDFSPDNVTGASLRRGAWEIWWFRDYTTYGQAVGRPQDFDLATWSVRDRMIVYIRKDVAAQVWDMGVGAEVISEFETSLSDLWTSRPADLIIGGAEGSLPSQLDHPRDVAVSDAGLVYVADSLNHRIQVYNQAGELVNGWGMMEVGEQGQATGGNFNQPWGLDIGPDGNIYVADTWNHRVQVFTPDGEFIRTWGQLGQLQEAEAPFDFWGPREVMVDDEGFVYVADTGNKRIRVYTAAGELVREIGIGGSGPGQLNEPVGLAYHPDGRVFVADTWNRRIQAFNRDGTFLASWTVNGWFGDRGNRPYLALDAERGLLYVSDPEAARILVYDFSGMMLGSFGELGPEEGTLTITQFRIPGGIDVDAQGNLWVADAEGARIVRFPPWDEIAVPQAPADDAPADDESGAALDEQSADEQPPAGSGLEIQDAGDGAPGDALDAQEPTIDPLDAPPPDDAAPADETEPDAPADDASGS